MASTKAKTKEIIVLGASHAGFSVTHSILRFILPALPNKGADYHVTLIDRDAIWFYRISAPRLITSEENMPFAKVMLPVIDGFKEHEDSNKFSFLQGRATSFESNARTLSVLKSDGTTEVVPFYALVFCIGASSQSPILGTQVLAGQEKSVEAIKAFRAKLPEAKNIIISGGGPAGVEVAGELGEFLNGKPGWFTSEPKTIKTNITVVTSGKQLLPALRPSLGTKAEGFLKKVGVKVIYETSVVKTFPERAGRLDATQTSIENVTAPAKVTLSNGEVLNSDLYIPAYGLIPNTDWLPKKYLTADGKLAADTYARLPAAGPRVYAVGDVAKYGGAGTGGFMEMIWSVPTAITNIKRDLLHDALEDEDAKKTTDTKGKDRPFDLKPNESQLVPIGKTNGVGAMFGWQVPSFFVWLIKGRDYMTSKESSHPKGGMFTKESKWNDM
jgi:NADH dehydrogenase FAD-containing subunit